MAANPERRARAVAENRKARFNFEIGETYEAGIVLTGSEVKSLRAGKATIAESYADAKDGEIWLINANIPEYLQAHRYNHTPKRPRKLLLHQRQPSGFELGTRAYEQIGASRARDQAGPRLDAVRVLPRRRGHIDAALPTRKLLCERAPFGLARKNVEGRC